MTTSSAALIAALLGIALNNYSAEATEPAQDGAPTTQSTRTSQTSQPSQTLPSPVNAPAARPQMLPTANPASGETVRPVKRQMAPLRPGDRFAWMETALQHVAA
ncbi:MAG TPA: hypothetical protein PLP91_04545 [Plasticicumulans sp.]|uniref:hypothetical protein n=1 Tax=Plasticicumulans sp. TaxID=2307179 RepID=UPI002D026942|nr:hypothetical protein [Plasticicumulans sp.]HNI23727.1 hypothetical protein [Plasticicumulans sp.]